MDARDRHLAMLESVRREFDGPPRRLIDEARRFLDSLEADSSEALWFEELARSYPSRLAAAMAYVQEVRGVPPD